MSTETQKIDVLSWFDSYIRRNGIYGEDGIPVRFAVAELVAASRELQEAMDEQETGKFDVTPSKNFLVADARHRAALARIGGKP